MIVRFREPARLHPSSADATNPLSGRTRAHAAGWSGRTSKHMTYFFFGTLMDSEVLATVLDRPVAAEIKMTFRKRGFPAPG